MKRLNLFIEASAKVKIYLIAAIALLTFAQINAQTAVTKEKQSDALLVSFPSTLVNGVTTVYSYPFTLEGFNQSITTSNLANYTKTLTSASSKPRITTLLQGSNDGTNYFTLDTLGIIADSIETAQKGTFDLNVINNSNRFNYYRFAIVGETSNPTDAYVKEELYITK